MPKTISSTTLWSECADPGLFTYTFLGDRDEKSDETGSIYPLRRGTGHITSPVPPVLLLSGGCRTHAVRDGSSGLPEDNGISPPSRPSLSSLVMVPAVAPVTFSGVGGPPFLLMASFVEEPPCASPMNGDGLLRGGDMFALHCALPVLRHRICLLYRSQLPVKLGIGLPNRYPVEWLRVAQPLTS